MDSTAAGIVVVVAAVVDTSGHRPVAERTVCDSSVAAGMRATTGSVPYQQLHSHSNCPMATQSAEADSGEAGTTSSGRAGKGIASVGGRRRKSPAREIVADRTQTCSCGLTADRRAALLTPSTAHTNITGSQWRSRFVGEKVRG